MAQGEFAELVDDVGADSDGGGGLVAGGGFGAGEVGLFGREVVWVGAVAALGVVDDAEGVEEFLEFGQGGWVGSCGQPAFEGLVEAIDLSLGLGVAGVAVALGDAQGGQESFEVVVAAGESRGVDRAVVLRPTAPRRIPLADGGPTPALRRAARSGGHRAGRQRPSWAGAIRLAVARLLWPPAATHRRVVRVTTVWRG